MNKRKEYRPVFNIPAGFPNELRAELKQSAKDGFHNCVRSSKGFFPHNFGAMAGKIIVMYHFENCKATEEDGRLIIRPVYKGTILG